MQRSLSLDLPSDRWREENAHEPWVWRAALEAHGAPRAIVDQLRVECPRASLRITAGTPSASEWLGENEPLVARAIASRLTEAAGVVIRERQVFTRFADEELFAYRFDRLVVAKPGSHDWDRFNGRPLPGEAFAPLASMIERGIRRDLEAWGELPPRLKNGEPFLVIVDGGVAVGVPALPGRGGSPQRLPVLVRRGVIALSPLRINGSVYAGHLNSLGFGRAQRALAPQQIDRDAQRRLLALALCE